MKKYIKTTYMVMLGLALSVLGCDYGDENIDPGRQGDVNIEFILPSALAQAATNQMGGSARIAAHVMQHFFGLDAQQISYYNYILDQNTLGAYWNNGLYSGVMKDCDDMISKSEAAGNIPHYAGIAKILMANALGSGTSVFGDMPYTEALKGLDNEKPAYDTQESIYNAVQTLLDEAIVSLSETQNNPVRNDLIFDGNISKWIATAHALKARYYMHTSKRNPSDIAKALIEVGLGFDLGFDSSKNQPDFNFEKAIAFANPFALFGTGRPNTISFNNLFVTRLSAASDPRLFVYAAIHESGTFWRYYANEEDDPDLFWAENDAPSPLISYTELMLIKAEAQIRTGASGDAALQDAVSSNMDYLGISAADRNFYLANITSPASVQTVIEEAYVALYGQAELEVWTNYRRTGFPNLTPNPLGVNVFNASGTIPSRIPYPQNERITNSVSLDAAVANQGADFNDTKLWAFK